MIRVKKRTTLFDKKEFATKKQKMTKILQEKQFLRDDWTIHKERCEKDPMYQLLFFPNEPLPLYNRDGQLVESVTFIDRILGECIKLIMKRCEGYIETVACISDAFSFLQTPDIADTRIKLFVLLFLAHRIPPIRELLHGLYDDQIAPTHPWGSARFVKFMQHVDKWCEMTLDFPYSERNIVTIVRNFCYATMSTYMVGT